MQRLNNIPLDYVQRLMWQNAKETQIVVYLIFEAGGSSNLPPMIQITMMPICMHVCMYVYGTSWTLSVL